MKLYKPAVLRQGPISQFLHGAIEYAAGVLFIAAPFIFTFDTGGATAAAIVIGVLVIFVASITRGPTSLIDSLPLAVHIAIDYVLSAVLIAIPFLFGFSGDDSSATIFFIAIGIVHLLMTVATRFTRTERGARPA